ncbi:MAG: polysulfide reductase NrfD [Alphaproteobacteria bacterium]|nr:polysulfide reductase NrfD [Alphaproteobacteria bacterium]
MRAVPRQQGNWDWRAAGNFLGGGAGTGLLLFAALGGIAGLPVGPIVLLALALIAGGLGFVWLEIGRPWRFLNVYFNPRTSWMTREAYAALPVFAAGLAALWLGPPMIALAALCALVFLYCQGRILRAAKGIPAWREPMIVPLALATGLAEGGGLFLMATPFLGAAPRWALLAFIVMMLLRLGVWTAYRSRLIAAGAPQETLAVLARTARAVAILGVWLPLLAAVAAFEVALLAPVAGACALAGGWWLKFTLVTRAAQTQGFALAHTPARGAGAAGPGARPGWTGRTA